MSPLALDIRPMLTEPKVHGEVLQSFIKRSSRLGRTGVNVPDGRWDDH